MLIICNFLFFPFCKKFKFQNSLKLITLLEKPIASVSLNFLTNSGVSTIYDESVVVPAGSHILLFCHVTGFPIPRIAWLKDHDVFTGTKEKYQFYNQSAIEAKTFFFLIYLFQSLENHLWLHCYFIYFNL